MTRTKRYGFTIVELLIVIVVIAILAAIVTVAYRGLQDRAAFSTMASDLAAASRAFDLYKVDNDTYPSSMPSTVKASKDIVLSATIAPQGEYCINAYHINKPTLKSSWHSNSKLQQSSHCSGAAIGTTAGGAVPAAPRGVNIAPSFSQWVLTGTATYNNSTQEIDLGSNGTARSPLIRVDQPGSFSYTIDAYTTAQASNFTPQGGYLSGMSYYGSDSVTPALNSNNYTSNGCARAVPLNTWQTPATSCGYAGGPNVYYITYNFSSGNSQWSPNLIMRNPVLTLSN